MRVCSRQCAKAAAALLGLAASASAAPVAAPAQPSSLEPPPFIIVEPCMPGPYLVFFELGSDDITAPARGILDLAADQFHCGHFTGATLSGHSDTSPREKDNLILSRRRGEKVKRYLIRQGVPASAITIAAFGSSRPLVAERDGVPDEQNQRVEINFRDDSAWPADAPKRRGHAQPR